MSPALDAHDDHGPALVRARGLRRSYGPVEALRGVDLEVARGESLLVAGDNGSGKTTLLRLLTGLGNPGSGSLEVFGQPAPLDAGCRRRIGMLAHETWLYPDLGAAENLSYYARLYGVAEARADAALARVGLSGIDGRPVRNYSRGMAQLLALARAIVHEPELLLLDEPFTGLDRTAVTRARAILEDLGAGGTTVVMATHDIEKADGWASRAILIQQGRVVWDSGPSRPEASRIAGAWDEAHRGAN